MGLSESELGLRYQVRPLSLATGMNLCVLIMDSGFVACSRSAILD